MSPVPHALNAPIELSFSARELIDSLYPGCDLVVDFTSPTGARYAATGFWNGGRDWQVRFAADETGAWSWRSRSSDAGLDGNSGVVDVTPTAELNSWRRHGRLVLHPSGRAFAHADGTPVFWLADTEWAAPAHATVEEWLELVARRARQGFNVVQINSLPQWDASGPPLRQPFALLDGKDEPARPDPAYFQTLDEIVRIAFEAGMIPAIVVLWFDYTPSDNASWPVPRRGPFTAATAAAHARHLVARYEAYGATWIVSGDTGFGDAGSNELYDHAAAAIRSAAARPPLLTAHLNGGTAPPAALNDRPWLDYWVFQSGHYGDSAERARRYAADARGFVPRRPVLNSEPCYDSIRLFDTDSGNRRASREEVRRAAWVSVLSGASAGVTYGAHGTWPWHRAGQLYAASSYGEPLNWREALALESGNDMGLLRSFFEELPWWDIAPATGIGSDPPSALLATASAGPDTTLCYVAGPAELTLPSSLAAGADAAWYDPTTGARTSARLGVDGDAPRVELSAPADDAVLMMRRFGSV